MRKLDVFVVPTARPQTGGEIPVATLGFLEAFHRRQISYCYWKSSRRLASVLAGDGDLDLLIAREDQPRAEAILLDNGFKRFPSVANRDHPSIASFLGYDEPTDRLVHVHAQFRLMLGEHLLKNYCLPWEKLVLARAVHH